MDVPGRHCEQEIPVDSETQEGASLADGAEVVWSGSEDLRPLLRPISELHEDPVNAKTHDERSLRGIAAAFAESGQCKPSVVNGQGRMLAGNGEPRTVRIEVPALECRIDKLIDALRHPGKGLRFRLPEGTDVAPRKRVVK